MLEESYLLRHARRRRSFLGLLLCCVCYFADGGKFAEATSGKEPADQVWRLPENDGINCLFVFLDVYGKSQPYEHVVSSLAGSSNAQTLHSLQAASKKMGLATLVRQCAPAEIRPIHLPAIAHLDSVRSDHGRFVLLVGLTEKMCVLFEGSTFVYREIPIAEFRRRWSGHVLLAATHDRSHLPLVIAVIVGIMAVTSVFVLRLNAVRKNPQNICSKR